MVRFTLAFAALSGAISVMAGAFAAHGLQHRLEPQLLNAFRTGAEYQLVHSIVLLVIAVLMLLKSGAATSWLNASAVAMMLGVVLFSGSLYALSLSGVGKLGIITPFGGLALITGWLLLAFAAIKLG